MVKPKRGFRGFSVKPKMLFPRAGSMMYFWLTIALVLVTLPMNGAQSK